MAKVQDSRFKSTTELAEEQHVEDTVGDRVRAALTPFIDYLKDVNPEGYSELNEQELTGVEWISLFSAPMRWGWRDKRYDSKVVWQIAEVIYSVEQLSERVAEAYRAKG